jgi:capsular polysaccharide biosynthesis protein
MAPAPAVIGGLSESNDARWNRRGSGSGDGSPGKVRSSLDMSGSAPPLSAAYPKVTAFEELALRAGIANADGYGRDVAKTLTQIECFLAPIRNTGLTHATSDEGLDEQLVHPPLVRNLRPPVHLCEAPSSVPHTATVGFTPEFKILSLPDGCLYTGPYSPVIIDTAKSSVITKYSSQFSRLIYYYNDDAINVISKARYVDGSVFVMFDDIAPLNYCHWLVDGLPRLAALGFSTRRKDCYVATSSIEAGWQIETLKLCGFDEDRILGLSDFEAVRARRLVVPSQLALSEIPHPAFKGAPWALAYLRATLGYGTTGDRGDRRRDDFGSKLYISRADAAGRRILNEDKLYEVLETCGFERVCLGGLSFGQQVRLFSSASHIVGIHGAGLANLVFAGRDCKVLEIFPATYGTPAYYILAAAQELPYYTYVSDNIETGTHPTFDDMTVDIDHFVAACGKIIGERGRFAARRRRPKLSRASTK